MKLVLSILMTLLLLACHSGGTQIAGNDGGISGTGDGSSKSTISGATYKGPMTQDSIIRLFKIISGVVATDFTEAKVISNTGNYSIELDNGLYLLQANGTYYDETTGAFSTESVELKAIANIDSNSEVFINVLTHLSHDYTLNLIAAGDDYATARQKAKARTLELLKPITGETNLSVNVNQIGLSQANNPSAADAAYIAYISTLVVQTAADNASLTTNSILSELANDVATGNDIDDTTLSALLISHANIDENTVDANIGFIFNNNNAATITDTVTDIDVFNPALPAPNYEIINSGADYRFFFDGSMSDGSGGISGRSILIGGRYEIQISTAANFSTLEVTNNNIPSNTFSTASSNFIGTGKRYVRVRKIKDNGQHSQWSGVLEFTI